MQKEAVKWHESRIELYKMLKGSMETYTPILGDWSPAPALQRRSLAMKMTRNYLRLVLPLLIIASNLVTNAACANKRRILHLASGSRTPTLFYHGGTILTGPSLRLHLLWYGTFSDEQQSAITDFISSFQADSVPAPSVASWWNTISLYHDASDAAACSLLRLGSIAHDPSYTMGKTLTKTQISTLLENTISQGTLPNYNAAASGSAGSSSIYVVFTAADVVVENFCRSSCGFHSTASSGEIPYIWVGNPAKQCRGLCAWPFAVPRYGPPRQPLVPPSGNAATDGMIINLATLLAGIVTNPFGKGYLPDPISDYNGEDGNDGGEVEAATACVGIFGAGSYPGFPGNHLADSASGAAYNVNGLNNRHFLLPSIWSPTSLTCETLS